jgi:endogenous inhibitor of DNA gyrase (YacG/DUF329 family)
MATMKCPTCETVIEWGPQFPYRPFCSKRCRLIDFGAWLDGSNRLPGSELDDDAIAQLDPHGRSANDENDGFQG